LVETRTRIPEHPRPAFEEFTIGKPVSSLLAVTRGVLFTPRKFFGRLPPDGAIWPPVLYFLICYLTGSVLEVVSSAAFLEGSASLGLLLSVLTPWPILMFLVVPAQHTLLFFLSDDERHGMGTTLRISCYAVGAVALIVWIPLVDLLVVLHLTYILISGFRKGHGVTYARALVPSLLLAGLLCVPVISGVILEYRAVQEVTQEPPLSYAYFPPPERSADLPPGVTGAVALLDSSENQEKVARLRDASYADMVPSYERGMMVTVFTADQEEPRGVVGYAHGSPAGSPNETMGIDAEHQGEDRAGTDHISYYADERESTTPHDRDTKTERMKVLFQSFDLSRGSYTLNLRQIGKEPRSIEVTTYFGTVSASGRATFYVAYRLARPGDRFRLKIRSDCPLDDLRLEVDRGGDGTYDESWMPEVTIVGTGVNDWTPPVTKAHIEGDPSTGDHLMLSFEAEDYSDSEKVPPSAVGITYYWINDSGPRIYMKPIPVEPGDTISYWSLDRNGNIEWRRSGDVQKKLAPG
jgi:hypothetical protein